MELKLLHLCPDLMSLYGEWANLALLRRHLEDLGNTVTVERADPGAEPDLAGADFIFMGAGTERSQKAALAALGPWRSALREAAEAGRPMLFTGTALDLLGRGIIDARGRVYEGLGLAAFTAEETDRRIVGDVLGDCALAEGPVVGFMNKCSLLHGVETPFLTRCALGFGNEAELGPEGYWEGRVLGTHLTGPLLVKNPALARWFVEAVYACRGETPPAEAPEYPYEERGYQVTVSELRKRAERN